MSRRLRVCPVFTRVVPKDEPANFPGEAEFQTKFAGLTDAVLGPGVACALADDILRLDQLDGITDVMRQRQSRSRHVPASGITLRAAE